MLVGVQRQVAEETLAVPQNYLACMFIGSCVQRLLNAHKELFSKSLFIDFSAVMAFYMILDSTTC